MPAKNIPPLHQRTNLPQNSPFTRISTTSVIAYRRRGGGWELLAKRNSYNIIIYYTYHDRDDVHIYVYFNIYHKYYGPLSGQRHGEYITVMTTTTTTTIIIIIIVRRDIVCGRYNIIIYESECCRGKPLRGSRAVYNWKRHARLPHWHCIPPRSVWRWHDFCRLSRQISSDVVYRYHGYVSLLASPPSRLGVYNNNNKSCINTQRLSSNAQSHIISIDLCYSVYRTVGATKSCCYKPNIV